MKIIISEAGITKAKNAIKELKRHKKIWIKTKEQAEAQLNKLPTKYIYNIKQRIKEASKKIYEYDRKITEFNKLVKEKEIEI